MFRTTAIDGIEVVEPVISGDQLAEILQQTIQQNAVVLEMNRRIIETLTPRLPRPQSTAE